MRIAVPLPASVAVENAYFYPERSGIIDHAAPQAVTRSGDQLVLAMPAAAVPTPGPVTGVLSIGRGQGLSFAAKPGVIAGASGAANHGFGAIALAFLGAVLGGLLLNIMPCVFPILSLKALSLAKGGGDERHARPRRWPIRRASCWCAWGWASYCWRCALAGRARAGRSSFRTRA